ncbi:glutathione S-transferase family protein [Paracraurococcus lichenis]|uniref:Glutathione S-transferase N-terminal domain-containing protein n=1 Tax=Paracraurococcus lichenis TaxID=3064888 RepID=A0ABT9DS99_9PROT|nr:glutathione S-transferase N-terminal domain-containing protein [Paracraurococcus sp. LOR1-02]MDO9706758.1 glutathione S-transferase N-terminal domain-containing protein [Paracraurococcus sp. LOR1-02]
MLQFYYNTAPNPMKVALFLEESGLPYEAIPLDTRKGEQFTPEYVAINPNSKAPSIVDDGKPVFDSNAILLYLAEKTGQFLPEPAFAGETLSWLMFIATGIGPYSGQCVHFRHFAPPGNDYAVKRYVFEAERHWGILNDRLAGRDWLVGDSYSIVDMAAWGWERAAPFALGQEAFDKLTNVKRHFAAISERPAAQRAAAIKDRHAFKTEMDEEARKIMFRHTAT